jgi:hypothetical protein
MKFPRRARFGVMAGWLAVQFFAAPLFAQPAPPLPPAGAPSPVETFRKLLAMTPAEQKQYLAVRPPELQARILAKVREYESLRPNDRELRLRATELEWYLSPLLTAPVASRPAQLAAVPDNLRPLIADRLKLWDALPADAQKELLDNEATLRYFTELQTNGQPASPDISPARREKLEAGITAWRALPEAQRQTMLDRFNEFFDLTPAERAATLGDLSEAERQQMDKTLRRFEKLPPGQREQCIQAFAEFTSMSLADRQQFLKNAERWKVMSPDERQAWRDLVLKLPDSPPLPPGLSPPLPATASARMVTNGN